MAHYQGSHSEGAKARSLALEREKAQDRFKQLQDEIKAANSVKLTAMEHAFQTKEALTEEQFKAATVGLVSAEEYKRRREQMEEASKEAEQAKAKEAEKERKKKEKERKKKLKSLSFDLDEEEGQEEAVSSSSKRQREEKKDASSSSSSAADGPASSAANTAAGSSATSTAAPASFSSSSLPPSKRVKTNKDPTADTSFLPDRARELEEQALRERLAREWAEKQEAIKKEAIQITYSYWDGSGHRNKTVVQKGATIAQFLEQARKQIVHEFPELRGLGSDGLLYIKEDLMIPHHYTFYDLIVTKARGKSGPLFHFDVHDDVRMTVDASVEKDESHAGKIVTKAYYERNKNNFPASRWEVFDPTKRFEQYTIKGGEVRGAFANK